LFYSKEILQGQYRDIFEMFSHTQQVL